MATTPFPLPKSLSLHSTTPRFLLLPATNFHTSHFLKIQHARPNLLPTLSIQSFSSVSIKASPSGDIDTSFFDNADPNEETPLEAPKGSILQPYFDEGPMETEEEIVVAYEERYGPTYSGISYLGNDVDVMDSKLKARSRDRDEKIRDGFEERVVQVRRVTKVVKGGKNLNFRAVVVVSDKKRSSGCRCWQGQGDCFCYSEKSAIDARRNIITPSGQIYDFSA